MDSIFIITDGKGRYMRRDCTGRYTITRNRSLADEYTARYSAANALKSSIPAKIKRGFYVHEEGVSCNKTGVKKPKSVQNTPKPEQKMDNHIDEVKKLSVKVFSCGKLDELSSGINSLVNLMVDVSARKDELNQALSKVDLALSDIDHYIEKVDLGVVHGFYTYKMRQNFLRKRRKIKDELSVVSELYGCQMDEVSLKEVQLRISSLEHRKYTPRVLFQLFDRGGIKNTYNQVMHS